MVGQILANTPKWVFLVFVVLLAYGSFLLKPRVMNKGRLMTLPIAMTCMSISGVLSSFGLALHSLGPWVVGYLLALLANRFVGAPGGVTYDAAKRLFHIPGSWAPMALMMGIFTCNYIIGATRAMRPDVAALPEFAMVLATFFGFFSGTFFARFLKTRAAAAGAAPVPAAADAEAVRSAS